MTERIVYTYADKKAIGTIKMTDKQYAQYVAESDAHLKWKSTQTQPLPDSSPLQQPPAAPTAHAE